MFNVIANLINVTFKYDCYVLLLLNIISELLSMLRIYYIEYYAVICVFKLLIDIPKEAIKCMMLSK